MFVAGGKDVKPVVNGSGGTHIVLPQCSDMAKGVLDS